MKASELNTEQKNYWLLIASFAAVYVIWGSTYLAIHFALKTIPPFFMAGTRFLIAGAILYFFARFSGAPKPSLLHCKNASVIGILLLVCGNGGVVYAQQMVPSGITSLIVSIEPVWVVLILWLGKSGKAPSIYAWLGLFLGLLGMVILLGSHSSDMVNVSPKGFIILLCSTFSWALGSVYAVNAAAPKSPSMATSLQMIAGGFVLSCISFFIGEWERLSYHSISSSSVLSVLYLIVFGSIVGYSAYSFLTRTVSPSQVSTYAYVNPVIAVFLGTWLGKEALTKQILIATPILVIAVVLLIWKTSPKISVNENNKSEK